jgi:exosome complex component RRP42
MMYETVIAEIKRDYVLRLLEEEGKRSDGRSPEEYRPISLETGVSGRAEGSSLVKIGATQVMVGVKLLIGAPFPDMPGYGVLMTNAELNPLASPKFEMGPPREDTVELARVVDRAIRESHAIDLEKLCLEEGEKVWMTFIDIHVLDYDGNLFDASTLGATAALLDTRFPKLEGDRILYGEKTKTKLPVQAKPIENTFVKLGKHVLLDPALEEEIAMDARITVGTNDEGDLCAMQKGGSGTFSQEEIVEIVEMSKEKGKELRKLLK